MHCPHSGYQGGSHSHYHIVHFTGASGHSSEEEEQDDEEDGEEAVSFEDMLAQARAQSDKRMRTATTRILSHTSSTAKTITPRMGQDIPPRHPLK